MSRSPAPVLSDHMAYSKDQAYFTRYSRGWNLASFLEMERGFRDAGRERGKGVAADTDSLVIGQLFTDLSLLSALLSLKSSLTRLCCLALIYLSLPLTLMTHKRSVPVTVAPSRCMNEAPLYLLLPLVVEP